MQAKKFVREKCCFKGICFSKCSKDPLVAPMQVKSEGHSLTRSINALPALLTRSYDTGSSTWVLIISYLYDVLANFVQDIKYE